MQRFIVILFALIVICTSRAQITPAGFDHTQLVSWEAMGLSQDLDSVGKMSVLTYFGIGMESRPDDVNLFERPGILVADQSFRHEIHPNWKYTLGLSYRLQHHYSDKFPYLHDTPGKVNEIRAYLSTSWYHIFHSVKWEITFKQELRNFFSHESVLPAPQIGLRSRLKSKWRLSLGRIHGLVLQAEGLFSTGKLYGEKWSKFHYSDARISLFYSLTPPKWPVKLDLGYMNELRGFPVNEDISFLALNVIWTNPFNRLKK